MSQHIQQSLLSLQGIVRTLREEASEARTKGWQIEPVALEHYAALLDKARDTLAIDHAQRVTNNDAAWLRTLMKLMADCVKRAEARGGAISVGEIRALIEVIEQERVQGGAQ